MAYIDAAAIRTYLKIASTAEDAAVITPIASRAQDWIERETGSIFEAVAPSPRYFDAMKDVYLDEDGRRSILMFDKFTYSISSITNGDGDVIESTQYVTQPINDTPYWAVKLKRSAGVAWTYTDDPENAIVVQALWARCATPPGDIVQATLELSAWLYRRRGTEGTGLDRITVSPSGVTMAPLGFPEFVVSTVRRYQPVGTK